MQKTVLAVVAGLVIAGLVWAQQPAAAPMPLKDTKQKYSYAIGMNIGKNFKDKIDVDALMRGLRDAVSDVPPALNEQEFTDAMNALQQIMLADEEKVVADMSKKGEDFLAENKKKADVKTLPSGLQYRVIKQGNGPSPKATDTVTAHYTGRLPDGTVFDSSTERGMPITFPITQVIKGWTEALQLMKVGDKWELFIPSNLAYGPEGRPPAIPPNATLVFEVELLSIQ
ncbi:MAG TPA: FKBP-type peptidyl-prolyl cis-trans isomerase [Pirellulales bacterium]|jgi:FKBP-type peptidyl-prolyl cis-trans isomerase|nr:FKBP-type peptidyl-prolyl cis-trans isomerase [Pirellulales bacterium]